MLPELAVNVKGVTPPVLLNVKILFTAMVFAEGVIASTAFKVTTLSAVLPMSSVTVTVVVPGLAAAVNIPVEAPILPFEVENAYTVDPFEAEKVKRSETTKVFVVGVMARAVFTFNIDCEVFPRESVSFMVAAAIELAGAVNIPVEAPISPPSEVVTENVKGPTPPL